MPALELHGGRTLQFAAMETREIRLARRPHGEPVARGLRARRARARRARRGQLLVRNLFMSVDPYMRGRMNDAKSYAPPYELGEAMYGGAVGEVVAGGEAGALVVHQLGWREHALVDADRVQRGALPDGVPPSALLGALGMPGLTAWVGVTDIAPVREGETVFVSAAAGAVGSVAGQIAKARGCRVIGSAGAPEKVAYVRDELGFDAAFDYRDDVPRGARARRRPTASTSTSTTSAARSSRPPSARSTAAAGSRSAAPSRSTTRPSRRPARATWRCSSASAARCAASSSATTRDRERRVPRRGRRPDRRRALTLAETVVEGGMEAAPGAFIDMLRGKHLGKVVVAL